MRDIGREAYLCAKWFVSSAPVFSHLLAADWGRQIVEPEPKDSITIGIPDVHHDEVEVLQASESTSEGNGRKTKNKTKSKTRISVLHCDIVKDEFWDARPGILAS